MIKSNNPHPEPAKSKNCVPFAFWFVFIIKGLSAGFALFCLVWEMFASSFLKKQLQMVGFENFEESRSVF